VKSELPVYPGEGIGRDEGRIRLTPRPTFPYASKRDGDSADPRLCIAVDTGGDSISENRTRLLLRDSVIESVSAVLEMTDRRSSLYVELWDGRRRIEGDLHLLEHYLSVQPYSVCQILTSASIDFSR